MPLPSCCGEATGSATPKPREVASTVASGSPPGPFLLGSRSFSPETQYAWLPTTFRLAWFRAASTTYVTCAGLRSTLTVPRNAAAGAYWSLIASWR